MNEQDVRRIFKEMFDANYNSGSPKVAPHAHNGDDNFAVNPKDLIGFEPIPTSPAKYLNPFTGGYEYGYGAPQQLAPADSSSEAQYLLDPDLATYQIPIVVGNGVGTQSAFEGGYAKDGTLVYFANGTVLNGLYVRFDGQWYGVNLSLVV